MSFDSYLDLERVSLKRKESALLQADSNTARIKTQSLLQINAFTRQNGNWTFPEGDPPKYFVSNKCADLGFSSVTP